EVPLELVVDLCYNDLFRWELSKDPLATPVVRRLAAAWPAISQHGQKLRVYFVVRNPLDFVRSLLDHMGLKTKVKSANDQLFSWDVGQFPARFSAGKQQYLDVSLDNLTYSGYADALVQRWALVVDEYLACPRDFVLVRYEDFVQDPVSQTRLLLESLGLAERWSDGAEERVRRAAEVQYQTKGDRKQRDPEEAYVGTGAKLGTWHEQRHWLEALSQHHDCRSSARPCPNLRASVGLAWLGKESATAQTVFAL
ncbi:unnamed protein product, partial [Polarella glacialis]